MTPSFARWSGLSFAMAGLSLALWVLLHPWGEVAGAHVGNTPQWVTAHSFHFFAGLLAVFGLPGIGARHWKSLGHMGSLGFLLALGGSTLFAGTGMFSAWIWPILAVHAPNVVASSGPFFNPTHPIIVVTSVSLSLGYATMGLGLVRARAVTPAAGILLAVGAVLLAIPPAPLGPLPWGLFVAAGAATGAGMFWVGIDLGMEAERAKQSAPIPGHAT